MRALPQQKNVKVEQSTEKKHYFSNLSSKIIDDFVKMRLFPADEIDGNLLFFF
jgi:hypothetical protein